MTLRELDLSPWLVRSFAFVWGCLWASFVNVVIYRVPLGMSVVRPASHCPGCGAPVRAYDNLPIVSWLILRGRARCCGAKIAPRYVLVELLGGVVSLGIAWVVFGSVTSSEPALHVLAVFLADFALAMALLAAAFIDLDHMYLPDGITIGGTLFGLATPGLRGLSYADALAGAAVGLLGIWLPFVVGYKALRGKPGMGLGDAKLVMLAGAWFGWLGAAFSLFAGALQATVAALLVVAFGGKIEEPASVRAEREELQAAAAAGDEEAARALAEDPLGTAPAEGLMGARMPFGPFLCLAIVEFLLFGDLVRDALTLP